MNKAKYYDHLYWAKNPNEFEEFVEKYQRWINTNKNIKDAVIEIINSNYRKFNDIPFLFGSFRKYKSRNIHTWSDFVYAKKDFKRLYTKFSFLNFDEIEVSQIYKPVWWSKVKDFNWLPTKRNLKEFRKKFAEILYRIGFEIGAMETRLWASKFVVNILRNETKEWAIPIEISKIDSLPEKTKFEIISDFVKRNPKYWSELCIFETYFKKRFTKKRSDFIKFIKKLNSNISTRTINNKLISIGKKKSPQNL